MSRQRVILKQRYKKGVHLEQARGDIAHLVNTNTMTWAPHILESGVIECNDGTRVTYHDVRLFFPAAPMHGGK